MPSWTETLIEAGVEICGRTRFCIHPEPKVNSIPIVGGTKNVDWDLVHKLNPDLVLMDKEENPKTFSDFCKAPWYATHVLDLESCQKEMTALGAMLSNACLLDWAEQLAEILKKPPRKWDFNSIPGELYRLPNGNQKFEAVSYVIWKNPWMTVSPQTYIGSVLKFLGAPIAEVSGGNRYPEVDTEFLKNKYALFSSEPFPFFEKKEDLIRANFSGSIVDGEKFSWFGIRGLRFLAQGSTNILGDEGLKSKV